MKKISKLKNILILTVILAVIFTFTAYIAIFYNFYIDVVQKQVDNYLKILVEKESSEVSLKFDRISNQSVTMAKYLTLTGSLPDEEYIIKVLKLNLTNNDLIRGCGVWFEPYEFKSGQKYYGPYLYKDNNDNIILTWEYSNAKYDYFKYDWYKNGFRGKSFVWSDPYIDLVSSIPMVTITSPIYNKGKIIGVVNIDVTIKDLLKSLTSVKVGKNSFLFFENSKGVKITEENLKKYYFGYKTGKTAEIVKSYNTTIVYNAILNKKPVKVAISPVENTGLKIVLVFSEEELYQTINDHILQNFFILILSILIMFKFINNIFAKKVENPINQIIEASRKVSQGDFTVKVNIEPNNDFEVLAKSFNYMTENLIHFVKRENTISDIILAIRSSLELNEIKQIFVNELGQYFNADRVVFAEYNQEKGVFFTDKFSEYSTNDKMYSFIEYEWDVEVDKPFLELLTELKEINFSSIDNFFEKYGMDKVELKAIFEKWNTKASYNLLIVYGDNVLGFFCIDYINEHEIEKNDMDFLYTIANQAGIALYQAKTYESLQKTLTKNEILRKIIETIRSSLDVDYILKVIGESFAMLLDVQRVSIVEFPDLSSYIIRAEYKKEKEIKGLEIISISKNVIDYWINLIKKEKKSLILNNINDSDLPDYFKELYINLGVKSLIGVPIKKGDDVWGVITASEYNYIRNWQKEEIDLLESIIDQIYIAINQAELYQSVKQSAEKEKLLREILGEIRISPNLDEAYNYIVEKIGEIFEAERVFFVTFSDRYLKPYVKYEYLKDKEMPSFKNSVLPEMCQQVFSDVINNKEILVIDDVNKSHEDNKSAQEFYQKNCISSAILAPFLKFNNEVKVFGVLGICTKVLKTWQKDEVDILKSILESVITIIWEIMKVNEINELRDTFILTLAHDLQVPIIGQQKALEFIYTRDYNYPIGKYKEFISEAIQSNQSLFNLLTKLLDSYYYESRKKRLNISAFSLSDLINQILLKLNSSIEGKNISLEIQLDEDIGEISADKEEISKVINTFIENAIEYNRQNGRIKVSCVKEEAYITVCVSDNGMGVPIEFRNRLFERYAMAQVIERKIGSGLSLYLARQIIEAHSGKIWFTTEVNEGSTFCFNLPV